MLVLYVFSSTLPVLACYRIYSKCCFNENGILGSESVKLDTSFQPVSIFFFFLPRDTHVMYNRRFS